MLVTPAKDGDLRLAEPAGRCPVTARIAKVPILSNRVWPERARWDDQQVVAAPRVIVGRDDADLERHVRSEVASRGLTEAAFLSVDELDRGGLRRDVVLIADADHDQAATVVRHRGDVARQLAAVRVAGAVRDLLEVKVCVLPHAGVDQCFEVLLFDLVWRSAKHVSQADGPAWQCDVGAGHAAMVRLPRCLV